MSLKELYDQLDKLPEHRVPRCPKCNLILPCRNDGAYGPCDARELTTEAYDNFCALFRAIFDETDNTVEHTKQKKREYYERTTGRTVHARRPLPHGYVPPEAHCKNGHETTPENLYAKKSKGKLSVACRICAKLYYQNRKKNDQVGKGKNQRVVRCAGTAESVFDTEQGEPNRLHGCQ